MCIVWVWWQRPQYYSDPFDYRPKFIIWQPPLQSKRFLLYPKNTFKVDFEWHFPCWKTTTIHGAFCYLALILTHLLAEGLTDDQWHMLILSVGWISKICEVRNQLIFYFGLVSLGMESAWNIFRQFYGKWIGILPHRKCSLIPVQHMLNGVEVFIS